MESERSIGAGGNGHDVKSQALAPFPLGRCLRVRKVILRTTLKVTGLGLLLASMGSVGAESQPLSENFPHAKTEAQPDFRLPETAVIAGQAQADVVLTSAAPTSAAAPVLTVPHSVALTTDDRPLTDLPPKVEERPGVFLIVTFLALAVIGLGMALQQFLRRHAMPADN